MSPPEDRCQRPYRSSGDEIAARGWGPTDRSEACSEHGVLKHDVLKHGELKHGELKHDVLKYAEGEVRSMTAVGAERATAAH